MNFQREYLGYSIHNTADMLWLWYDYHTEIFDRSLPYTVTAPNDETAVIPTRLPYTSWSYNNAQKLLNDIYWIAKAHGVTAEEMFRAKMSEVRGRSSSQDRIDLFLKLDKKGQLEFIKDMIN
ncbi:hypothetical protein MOE50_21045 [Bacillus inaquosorum]|uniref:hypothetical protein n=1 Tax=Bacillus inaquosorum TaxID=483913 RepID=UPI00227FAD8C|nr:hypothetical protein [Bacillus inaquosorum]MCY9011436.1 hypothetical protein [Bacillus inaquosorum]MCY9039680.1 hypothetical protein [Bacillus inaquosorum]MCY9045134.1 hypothetical protein [Bacillus inaquosorum]